MATASVSVQWRVEGNSHYQGVVAGLAPAVRMTRYQKALTCYEKAFSTGTCDEDVSSAAKNAGLTTWKLAMLAVDTENKWPVIKRYFMQSLKYFNKAHRTGAVCGKSVEWKDNILANCRLGAFLKTPTSYVGTDCGIPEKGGQQLPVLQHNRDNTVTRGCWEDVGQATESLPDMDQEDRILTIRECIDYIPIMDMKADCYMEIAEFHFHRGIKALGDGDYKMCLHNMHDCHFPLAEAIKYGRYMDKIRSDHTKMETDVYTNTAIAESVQSRETGDALLAKILLDEESLNIDMVWEVIDWYKNAILKVRDIDMKEEAMALHKIGVVYDKVFKLKFKAKIYLKKALELAQSMTPVCFTSESWYQECASILGRYQRETVHDEQKQDAKEKQEAKQKLKPEIEELDKHETDTVLEFLKFVYKKYPRKNPNHKLNIEDGVTTLEFDQKYKLLQRAVIHFHPDKVRVEEEGLEAKVISEEVTKRLTNRYEIIKSQK